MSYNIMVKIYTVFSLKMLSIIEVDNKFISNQNQSNLNSLILPTKFLWQIDGDGN